MFASQAALPAPNQHFIVANAKSANEYCDGQTVVCWEAEHSLPGSVPVGEKYANSLLLCGCLLSK